MSAAEPLGARHPDVRRLRELLRDTRARAAEQAFVVEGPHALEGALDRGAPIADAYLGPRADTAFADLVARLHAAGVRVHELKEGVLEKVGSTRTPQPVLAVAPNVDEARSVHCALGGCCGSTHTRFAITSSELPSFGMRSFFASFAAFFGSGSKSSASLISRAVSPFAPR